MPASANRQRANGVWIDEAARKIKSLKVSKSSIALSSLGFYSPLDKGFVLPTYGEYTRVVAADDNARNVLTVSCIAARC